MRPAFNRLQAWAALRIQQLRRRPFPRLVAHFASVIIQSGQESGASELNLSLGALLAILAVPGGFMSILLFDKYSSLLAWMRRRPMLDPLVISIPDKYFFIVFSMVITGIVTVIKWDRILPGRQDYANLAPLPLPSRNILLANLAAIVLLASIFAIDVNAASAVLFPLVVLSGGARSSVPMFMGVHALCVILASAFTFFGCFAVMGLLMTCLPRRAFRPVSMIARLTILVILIAGLCTSFAVTPLLAKLHANPHSWVRFVPPLWYLGLYQALQGRAGPELAGLARVAWPAAVGTFLLALVLGSFSYARYFQRIPESADTPHPRSRRPVRILSHLLSRSILTSPVERACYRFGLRALLRSESHCILFGGFLGLGLVTASQMLVGGSRNESLPSADLLAAPLCVAYFLIIGLRFAFEVPAGQAANWVFRLILDGGKREAKQVARKLLLTFLIPLVLVPVLVVYWYVWGPEAALLHGMFVGGLSLLLAEAMLVRFRKIPFTSALPNLQNHAIVLILMYILGFWIFTEFAASVERWMFTNPIRFVGLPLFLGVAWSVLRSVQDEAEEIGDDLVFDAAASREVQTLNILGAE